MKNNFYILTLVFILYLSPLYASNHGISMHNTPQLEPGYKHFNYIDKTSLPGGQLVYAEIGGFNNLNPFTITGSAPVQIRDLVFESLLIRHYDEPFALYGLLAKSIEVAPDRSFIRFRLNQNAKFSNGDKVRVEDIIFSYELLKEKGRPNHRFYYNKVSHINYQTDNEITFFFNPEHQDRELPLIIGLMPILPKSVYQNKNFDQIGQMVPIGSGPYKIETVKFGKQITYQRNLNYWGEKERFNKHRHQVSKIIYNYYHDENIAFEAFKAGLVDIWVEDNPIRWIKEYDFPAFHKKRVIKENIKTKLPSGLYGFVFNTRRSIFRDQNIRQALDVMFNFPWVNKTFFGNKYIRTQSYFQNSDLSSYNTSINEAEAKILKNNTHLMKPYQALKGDIKGYNRQGRKVALNLFQQAGYHIKNGKMVSKKTGKDFKFEILVQKKRDEHIALSYKEMLTKIGINIKLRYVPDSAQYQNRLQNFDFDMIIYNWYASLSPGHEQSFYWGSKAANEKGSRNYAGIKNEYIDAAITSLTQAKTRQDLIAASRALDRLLMNGNYVIPLFFTPEQWITHWHYVKHGNHPIYGVRFDSWWSTNEP